MKKNLVNLLVSALFAVCVPGAKAEEDVITRTFPAKAGGKLTMNVDRGSIHVTTSDSDRVQVRITRELKSASTAEAKKVFEQHKIELTSTANEVKIEAKAPEKFSSFRNPFSRLQVDYTIAIPRRFDVNLNTAGGHIEVGDLEGKAVLRSSGGNLTVGLLKGPLKAHTSGGHITLTRVEGDADVDSSGGNLRLGEIDGNLLAHTSGGHITLEKNKGSINASTSGGNIEVNDANGPVNARTSGGHVTAHLNAQPASDCSLKTSGGNIEVLLAANLALDVDARTGGGRVNSDFPGAMNKEKTRLSAKLNEGGPELILDTSGGNINVRKK
jgi:DUF4097 and DUF4098 domain-containing protein YvlB